MSKMDAMRAMREARYAQTTSGAAAPARTTKAVAPKSDAAKVAAPKPAKARPAKATAAPEGEPCGHRNMGGRSCTRPHGHAEKSHRYS